MLETDFDYGALQELQDRSDFVIDLISPRFSGLTGNSTRHLSRDCMRARGEVTAKIIVGDWRFEKVDCLCGGDTFRLTAFHDRFGVPNPVSICRSCGLIQANPRLRAEDYSVFYQHFYRRLYGGCTPDVLFERQRGVGRVLHAWLAKQGFRLQPGELVVEIGTGAGGILETFKAAGQQVLGCDFDRAFLEYGLARGIPLTFGDATNLPCYGRAKLVILCHVFEHMLNPLKELKTVRQLLAADGVLLIEVPGVDYEVGPYKRGGHKPFDCLDYLQSAHTYHYDKDRFEQVMNEAGFSITVVNDKITALLKPRHPASYDKRPQAQAADASLPVLQHLRRLEGERMKRLWFNSWAFPLAEASNRYAGNLARRLGVVDMIRNRRYRI